MPDAGTRAGTLVPSGQDLGPAMGGFAKSALLWSRLRQWGGTPVVTDPTGRGSGPETRPVGHDAAGATGGARDAPGGQPPLGTALAVLPDAAVVVDADGRIVDANEAVEVLFGRPCSELVGQPVEVLVPERFRHAHRSHRGTFMGAPRRRAMGTGLQLYGRRRDASEFPIDISLAPVPATDPPLVVAAIRDASEREATAQALAQLAAIVSSSRDGMIVITPSGFITNWNTGAEQLLQTTSQDALGSHIGQWIPEEETEAVEELMGVILSGGAPPPKDTVWLGPGDKRIDVAISMSPMNDDLGELRAFSILVRDISDRKAAEANRRRQESWQAAVSEIRLASLSDVPIEEVLELVCRWAMELLGGSGSTVIKLQPSASVRASQGDVEEELAHELASTVAASGSATRSSWDLSIESGGTPYDAVAAPLPSGEPGALVVFLPLGRSSDERDTVIVESLAGQAAVAVELTEARRARDQVLLVADHERIARDLHDLVIQRLFATGMSLQAAQQLVADQEVTRRLAEATEELDATIREIRTTIFALEAQAGRAEGLRSELVRLVTGAAKTLRFHPSLQFDGPVDLVEPALQEHALAVATEALSNVARHAQASSASVTVSVTDDFRIVVEDDGIGPQEADRSSGVANLRERAEQLGGAFSIEPAAERGTRVVWQVPL